MAHGYLYCFSNVSYPGLLTVGMTERTPEDRAKELFTTAVPTPFKIELAKKVLNPKQKETTLHKLLSQYTERTNPNREFFHVSIVEVKPFFDLMDGEEWVETSIEEEEEEEADDDGEEDNQSTISNSPVLGCRVMKICFTNGQRIRHTIGINKTWIGVYDSLKNKILYDTKFYNSLSGFAEMHYSIDRTDRVKSANGWKECECEVNGKWISTYNLKPINELTGVNV